ncbi:hypothetical protein AX15_005800 [Amanita polypyramis BW_CC]|nr:hypothetical protein AX15_005800 [Amanita polypyramis BW_CC]
MWYNIRFKQLKEDMAEALDLDPITLKNIKTTMEWLADEFEKAGTDPKFAAQQATARVESVAASKTPSRINTPAPIPSPKARSRSADAILRSYPTTPENKESIDIRTPTPKKIQDRLQSVVSDLTSLEYIDEPAIKIEDTESKDIIMESVLVNPVPIKHRFHTDLVAEPTKSDKTTDKMDTSADFNNNKSSKQMADKSSSYHTCPLTISDNLSNLATDKDKGKEKNKRLNTLVHYLTEEQTLLDFMSLVKKHMGPSERAQFHKELDKKGYTARSAYLEVMLDTLFKEVIDTELHQGHYQHICSVYDNFNDPLEKFEDQIESIEKDSILFTILPYESYGDLLVQWLVTRKHIYNAIKTPSDGSMEKVTWAYLNTLFDHRFNDTLSEHDFLHAIKGLHGIQDISVQKKYDLESFGKPGIVASVHAVPTTMENVEQKQEEIPQKEEPSLLQQCHIKNRMANKPTSYNKVEVKDILVMASQLSDKLDIPIVEAFDKAEDILSITQSSKRSSSKSRSRSRGRQQSTKSSSMQKSIVQQPWHMADDPQKIMDLALTIKALLDAKLKEQVNKKKICPSMNHTAPPPLPTPPTPPGFYNQVASSSSMKLDRVTWAPMPQIARIDEVTDELQYPSSSLKEQIARDQEKQKNKSRPPPTGDSLLLYKEAFTAESFEKRSILSSKTSTATADMSSYAAAAK